MWFLTMFIQARLQGVEVQDAISELEQADVGEQVTWKWGMQSLIN